MTTAKKATLALVATLTLAASTLATAQQDTLAKIKNTGSVTLGVREASGAMSFTTGNGKYAGFHVEVCEKALQALQKQLALP